MGGEFFGWEMMDMWYDEIEDYDFDNVGYSEDMLNCMQVMLYFLNFFLGNV